MKTEDYGPYAGYGRAAGAIGGYSGKLMVNQMMQAGRVHIAPRETQQYQLRNFFHPYLRWEFTDTR